MKLQTGDAVLFNWKTTIFTKLITKFNESVYGRSVCTHAGLIIKTSEKHIWIAEPISYQGVKIYKYEKWWVEAKVVEKLLIIKRPISKTKEIYNNSSKYLNTKYGILDILSIGLYWAFRIKLKSTGKSRLICSEFVVRALYDSSDKRINLQKEFDKPFDLITPMDIYLSKQFREVKWN